MNDKMQNPDGKLNYSTGDKIHQDAFYEKLIQLGFDIF